MTGSADAPLSTVWFQDEAKNIISGTVVSVEGGTVVIQTLAGNYTRDRTDLTLGKDSKTAA